MDVESGRKENPVRSKLVFGKEVCFEIVPGRSGSARHLSLQSQHSCLKGNGQTPAIEPTLQAWNQATSEIRVALYRPLLELALANLYKGHPLITSYRQVEVLLGPLVTEVAGRIAKSMASLQALEVAGARFLSFTSRMEGKLSINLPRTTDESYLLLRSSEIDNLIDAVTIAHFFKERIEVDVSQESAPRQPTSDSNAKTVKEMTYLTIQKMLAGICRNNSFAIAGTYLGRLEEIALHAVLGQVPLFSEIAPSREASSSTQISRGLTVTASGSLLQIAMQLLTLCVPSSLLEELDETLKVASLMGYPSQPKVIFTSNNFGRNDEFKAYTAVHLSRASYIVGQHGNKYGTSKVRLLAPEISSADLFLSWGWKSDDANVYPFGVLKRPLKQLLPARTNTVNLILRFDFSGYVFADNITLWDRYIARVLRLCEELNSLGIYVKIRPHPQTTSYQLSYIDDAVSDLPYVTLLRRRHSFRKLVKRGARIVFTYDSTGMLEMAPLGLPFFFFPGDSLAEVKAEYRDNYTSLRTNALMSEDPAQAAKLILGWLRASIHHQAQFGAAVEGFARGIATQCEHRVLAVAKVLSGLARTRATEVD